MKLLALFISLFTVKILFGQPLEYKKINECSLNADSITSDNMPKQFSAIFQDKIIIALGENTHATSEYFVKKSEIIKYSVSKLGFKAVIFEADVVASKNIDKYIFKGEGNIDSLLFELGTKAWMVEEVRELLIWLKSYNTSKPDTDKVRFFGIDIQWSINIARKLIVNYRLETILTKDSYEHLESISNNGLKTSTNSSLTLLNELEKAAAYYPFGDSNEKVDFLELANLLYQSIDCKKSKDIVEISKKRDFYMAQHVMKVIDSLSYKSIIWAHNEHVLKSFNIAGAEAMGAWLSKKYQSLYYCIGFFLKEGELGYQNMITGMATTQKIPAFNKHNSLDYKLSKLIYPNVFIDVSTFDTMNNNSDNIFNKQITIRNIHLISVPKTKSYRIYNVTKRTRIVDEYDGIMFFSKTTGAKPIF